MLKIKYWFQLSRPQTLIASISPVILGSAFCYKHTHFFELNIFFATLIAAILIQIITNIINDLYDWKKGADTPNRLGPDRMVAKGFLNQREVVQAIKIIGVLTILIGLYLVFKGGWIILLIGLSSLMLAYLYTATSFSIAYNGYGEFFVFLYFGLIASIGTVFLQSSHFYYEALLIGCITGCLNVCLLVVNNLRDVKEDMQANKKTLIVRYGVFFGKIEFIIMIIAPYFFLYYLLTLLNLPLFIYSYIILGLFSVVLIFKICNNRMFLINQALKFLTVYIFSFTLLLLLNF